MLKLIRNPEIKKSLFIAFAINICFTFVTSFISIRLAIYIFFISIFWIAFYLLEKFIRYKKISQLNTNLEISLYTDQKLQLADYSEGELRILKSNIEKIFFRLNQQQNLLTRDKHFLADSLADISHQLRTPLTSLYLLFDRLKQEYLSENERNTINQDIYRLLNQIERLIDNLLIMSKLDTGTIVFNKEQCLVEDLLKQAIKPLEVKLEIKEIDVFCKLEGKIECDLFWTIEALTNILKNCLEHCQSGGTIKINSKNNPLYLELTIEDNGHGFDQIDLPHIFERFYRGNNSASDSIGIGLALARQIIQEQDGSLKARNQSTGGALFIIRFYKQILVST